MSRIVAITVSACGLAALAFLAPVDRAEAATFDLQFYRYCAPGSLCGFDSEQDFQDRICEAVQEMNVIWEVNGISFRPVVLPVDSDDPPGGVPDAPTNKNQYYEGAGCAGTDEDRELRKHWRENYAADDTSVLSMMITQGPNRCCSGIARTNKPPPGPIGIACDANRDSFDTGSIWAHEMGHHWGLSHTHSSCRDPADGSTLPPANNGDSINPWLCNGTPAIPGADPGCATNDDTYCSLIGAGTCEQDGLLTVIDTPPDLCKFEPCKRVCELDPDTGCAVDADCTSVGDCVCKAGGVDETVNGTLINNHEWIASVNSERAINAIMGTDAGSPHQTYCDVRLKERLSNLTVVKSGDASVVVRNVMSYHGASCRGPFVIDGIRYEAFTANQRDRIAQARLQIDTRADLVDVCANRGGDADHDGICHMDDNCATVRNTCQNLTDSDGDGTPNECDLCPYNPNPTGDIDDDGIGDICDDDMDNDGCPNLDENGNPYDQHPETRMIATGSAFNQSCGFGTETVYTFEGEDSDSDGVPNCHDPDDDNDGVCDDGAAFPPGTLGAANGCTAGPDLCPTVTGAFVCHLQGTPVLCPPHWLTCLGGSCVEFFLKVVQAINPDPTRELNFDHFTIYNRRFYVAGLPGMAASEGATAIQGLAGGGVGAGAGAPTNRVQMEIWSRRTNERVAVVGDFDASHIQLGDLRLGNTLLITPTMDQAGAPMLQIATVFGDGSEPDDGGPDADGDRYPDAFDNCVEVANPAQTDADKDRFGNSCDADLDGDVLVTQTDVDAIERCMGADLGIEPPILEPALNDDGEPLGELELPMPDPEALRLATECMAADLDDNRMVDGEDLEVAMSLLGRRPGPSGLADGGPLAVIVIGQAPGAPGFSAELTATLQTNGVIVSGTQNDITFDPQTPIAANAQGRPLCSDNPALERSDSVFGFQPPGCVVGANCTAVRAIIVDAANTEPIPDGSELYRCTVNVPATTPMDTYPLICSASEGSDPDGNFVAVGCRNGTVEVGEPPPPCGGDCDRSRRVVVSELIRGVNIALGRQGIDICPAFDVNNNLLVSINELVLAVNHALNGCPTE